MRRPMRSPMAFHRMVIRHGHTVMPMMGTRRVMVLHVTADHGTGVLHERQTTTHEEQHDHQGRHQTKGTKRGQHSKKASRSGF